MLKHRIKHFEDDETLKRKNENEGETKLVETDNNNSGKKQKFTQEPVEKECTEENSAEDEFTDPMPSDYED